MLLCDHIIFWHRHRARPICSLDDVERANRVRDERLLRACQIATARMIERMRRA